MRKSERERKKRERSKKREEGSQYEEYKLMNQIDNGKKSWVEIQKGVGGDLTRVGGDLTLRY